MSKSSLRKLREKKFWQSGKVRATIFFSALLVIGLIGKEYIANRGGNIFVTATVAPHFESKIDGNNLYINTNMVLYVNGKKIDY